MGADQNYENKERKSWIFLAAAAASSFGKKEVSAYSTDLLTPRKPWIDMASKVLHQKQSLHLVQSIIPEPLTHWYVK